MGSFGRLKKRADFLRIAAAQQKWVAPGLIIQMARAEEAGPRIGYTASKKVGNAVKRNRAKRRLREAWQEAILQQQPSGDTVLIARNATLDRAWADLINDIAIGVKKLNGRMTTK